MPTVKGYDGPNVETAPLQGGRSSASYSSESPLGNALSTIGGKVFADEMKRQDQVAFLESDRKLGEWENKNLYDPKSGALNKRGKDAFGVPDEVGKNFDGYVEELRKGLKNERQRVTFDRAASTRRKDINNTLSRHVFAESRKFEESETENYVANATQSAILNNNDPERVSLELGRAETAVRDFASRNGMGAEYVKQKVAQVRSNTHVGIVDRFLANGQDRTASEYFKANKVEIAGDDISKVEHKLKVATNEAEGLRGASAIWDKLGPKNDLDPVNTDKLTSEAEAKFAADPQVLKSVKQVLHERATMHNAAQRERREASSSSVWKVIEGGGTLASVRKMPEYLALPGHEQNTIKTWLIDRADAMKRRADAGEGDDALFYRLMTEASSVPLQDKFAQTNLMEHRANLSRAQFNTLINAQVSIRKGDTKETDKLLASERVQTQIVNEALLTMGLDPTLNEKGAVTDNGKQALAFRRAARESVRAHEIQSGKNATDADVQSIVDGLVIKGVTKKNIFFDDVKRVYELQPGESLTIKADDVPRAERAQIEAALRRAGRQVTSEAVTSLYTKKLLKMRGTDTTPDPRKAVPQ